MAVLLAVAAAIGWGASDYFGGDASGRRVPVFVVVCVVETLGVLALVPVLIARGAMPPHDPRLLFGALAGVAVTVELSLIFRALSRGQAFITAPTGALGTAAAVTAGIIAGDSLAPLIAVGLGCAVLGGGVSAWNPGDRGRREQGSAWPAVAVCLGAAAAVGTMLVSLHAAGRVDPYWATGVEHASTAVTAGAAALAGRRAPLARILPGRRDMPQLALVAAVGVGGDVAYASASHTGALSIVSAISSLYPVTTIALGRLLKSQRASRLQLAGIVLALAGGAILGAAMP